MVKLSADASVAILSSSPPVDEELRILLDDLFSLTMPSLKEFLRRHEIRRSGQKHELRDRIQAGLEGGLISREDIVDYLDEVIPWGKQHVYLFIGPQCSLTPWSNRDQLRELLIAHGLDDRLDAKLPLVLPSRMQISTIKHRPKQLRIVAVRRRDWTERDFRVNPEWHSRLGERIEFRPFIHRATRGLVAFEWDFTTNTAFLQITQLPGEVRYHDIAKEFFELIRGWLEIRMFKMPSLQRAIKNLHEMEELELGETRSNGVHYVTVEGRRIKGKSPSSIDSLVGEMPIDEAFSKLRNSAVGHEGDFFWLPRVTFPSVANPLTKELRVVILGSEKRISFPTPNRERDVRYVLSRIRSHCY